MDSVWRDLSYGIRSLLKNPGFTAVAVLSLAVGIGANSAIFSVTNALLLRPLSYADSDRLVILWSRSPGLNVPQDWFSPGMYLDIKLTNQVFEDVAICIGASFNMTGQGTPEHVDGARVSSSFFRLVGANALHGRVLLPEEDEPGKPQVVILGYGFWQRYCGSDPAIVGQRLILNGNSFNVVGVMPPAFVLNKEVMPAVNGIQKADLLVPLPLPESARANRGNEDFNIFGKLKPGVTVEQAQADMDVIAAEMKRQYPANYPPAGGLTISVVPLLEQVVGDIHGSLAVLFGAVGFVLLIACANVANLTLSRGAVRQREIAIRAAIGAGRARIIRQLLTESLILAVAGGIAGLAIAFVGVQALRALGSANIPRLDEIGVDARVLIFTFAVSLATGIISGLMPAMRGSRVDLTEALKEGGRGSSGGHHSTRALLVVLEVALSLVLLAGAGLLVRSYRLIGEANPGFDPHNVLSMRLSLPAIRYAKPDATRTFYRRLTETLKALPGVESAGVSYSLPLSTVALAWEPITVEGYVPRDGQELIISNVRIVNPAYFEAMRIPLVKGRYFDERDIEGAEETIIVDEAMAERFWSGQDPLGKRVQRASDGSWRTVVGVISNAREYSHEKEPPIAVYFPHDQYLARNMFLVARTTQEPELMTETVTRGIQSVDADMPVFDVASMDQRLYEALARRRFAMFLLGIFAIIALLLASIGIYGVMAYSVNQRTREIGVRLALGAQPRAILGLIVRRSLLLAGSGIGIGLIGAFALTRLMASLLYGVSATDLLTFAVMPVVLGGVALIAGYVPARRAAKVDPIVALRCE
jgi:predicted permease